MIIAITPIVTYYFISKKYINYSDQSAAKYLLNWSVVNLITSYCVFGLYPILCKKIGLVLTEEQFHNRNPDFFRFSAKRKPGAVVRISAAGVSYR